MLLSGKIDFDPKEMLEKLLLFNLKETSEEKTLDSLIERILDKNGIYYIEHRERRNAFRIRKDPKQGKKDELKTMLEKTDKVTKRATSNSKFSQLKWIKKQLIQNTKIWGKNLLNMNELKKLFKGLQADAKSVLFTGKKYKW